MKITLPLILSCFILSVVASAQITIGKNVFPKAGDTLLLATDHLPERIEIGEAGAGKSWNFINLKAPYANEIVVKSGKQVSPYFPPELLVLQLDKREWLYFQNSTEGLELVGEQNSTPLEVDIIAEAYYRPPILEQPADLKYGDKWADASTRYMPFAIDGNSLNLLNQLPVRPDSLRFRVAIERQNEVDAWGQLTLPGGIFDVLRVRRVEVQDIALDAKVGTSGWQDITQLTPSLEGIRKRHQISYHFLSDQASEPIAVVYTTSDDTPTKVTFKANRKSQIVRSTDATKGTVYAFPTEAFLYARFEFTDLPKGVYTLRLYNLLGIEVYNERYFVDGTRTEKVDVTQFQAGAYLYSLSDESGRIIATKRFYVKRP